MPLYYELKLVFLIWLAIPSFKGATKLWTDHNAKLDVWVTKAEGLIQKFQVGFDLEKSG